MLFHLLRFIFIFIRLGVKIEACVLKIVAHLALLVLREKLVRKILLLLNVIAVVIYIVFTRRIQKFLIFALRLSHLLLVNRSMLVFHLMNNVGFKLVWIVALLLPIIVIPLPVLIFPFIPSIIAILVSWLHLERCIENIWIFSITVGFYSSSHLERSVNIIIVTFIAEEAIVLFSKIKRSIYVSFLGVLVSSISLEFPISCSLSFSDGLSVPKIAKMVSSISVILVSISHFLLSLGLNFSDNCLKLLVGIEFIEESG